MAKKQGDQVSNLDNRLLVDTINDFQRLDIKVPQAISISCALSLLEMEDPYTKYEKKRITLAKELAEKDEKGEPKIQPIIFNGAPVLENGVPTTEYVFTPENREIFNKKLAELNETLVTIKFEKFTKEDIKGWDVEPGKISNYYLFLQHFLER